MQTNYQTKRLILNKLSLDDEAFIIELLNTPDWIKFIGDRNIRTQEDATAYIQKIIDNPNINYWVAKLPDEKTSIGIITFIKRDYLEQYDIGFAFLSKFANKGFAHEATLAVLNDVINSPSHTHILATTVKENTNSIKLLEKLGFRFEKEIEHENNLLLIYSVSVDKLIVNKITNSFYRLFTNTKQQIPVFEKIQEICLPETIIIKKGKDTEEIFNLETFIEPRKKILSDGTLTEFEEYELFEDTRLAANIAQRFSKYQKKGYSNGDYFKANGTKLFQYVKTNKGWKIISVIWEDESI